MGGRRSGRQQSKRHRRHQTKKGTRRGRERAKVAEVEQAKKAHRRVSCTERRRFQSRLYAVMEAEKAGSMPYRCQYCGHWHVTREATE